VPAQWQQATPGRQPVYPNTPPRQSGAAAVIIAVVVFIMLIMIISYFS